MVAVKKDEIRKIYEVLPWLNCGLCGYDNCGQFARAVAERRASPFGCIQDPSTGDRICQITGIKLQTRGYYGRQPVSPAGSGIASSPIELLEEVGGLTRRADDILARIEKMQAKKG